MSAICAPRTGHSRGDLPQVGIGRLLITQAELGFGDAGQRLALEVQRKLVDHRFLRLHGRIVIAGSFHGTAIVPLGEPRGERD